MRNEIIQTNTTLSITASTGSSANDFDFLAGQWNVHNRKLKSRLANNNEWLEFDAKHEMRILLNGLGNTDSMKTTLDRRPFEGITLRLFNPATRLWSIYWADSNNGVLDPPVTGSFEKNTGSFFGEDFFNGKIIIVKFNWNKTDPLNPVWSQAFSDDNGKNWEWNWYMYFTKTPYENK